MHIQRQHEAPTVFSHNRPSRPWYAAARIAGGYFVAGVCWIVASDLALATAGELHEAGAWIAILKGCAFITLSATLIYWITAKELRSTERAGILLQTILDGASDAVFVKDRAGRYLFMNTAAAEIAGKRREEIVGRTDFDIFEPAQAEQIVAVDKEVMQIGTMITAEESLSLRGETKVYSTRKKPFIDESGAIAGIIGVARDVSAEMAAQTAARESERRFRELADAVPQIIWTAGPHGDVLHLNAKAAEYAGLPPDEIKDWTWQRVIHPDDLALASEKWGESLHGSELSPIEFRMRRADGTYRWHTARRVPARDADGSIVGWYGTCTDIDDLKQAESEARRTREILRLVLDTIPIGVFWKGSDGRFQGCNRVGAGMVGLSSPHEIDGLVEADFRVLNAAQANYFAEQDRRIIETGIARSNFEEFVTFADGQSVWLSCTKVPMFNEHHKVVGMLGIVADITAAHDAAVALQENEEELRSAVEVAGLGVIRIDYEREAAELSPRAAALFGLPVGGAVNRDDLHKVIHPDDRKWVEERIAAALDPFGPGWFSVEHRVIHSDGSVRWLAVRKQVYFADGAPRSALVVAVDVTERRRSEELVRESEERYRRLVSVLPAAIFVHDGETIRFCNPAYLRLIGAEDEEQIHGKRAVDLVAEADREQVLARMATMARTGEPVPPIEIEIIRLDGKRVPVHSVSTPFRGYGQQSFLVALSDLTESRRSTELLRAVLGSVGDAILTIDRHGIVRSANPATERIFGYAAAELLGQNVNVLMPEPFHTEHDRYIANYVQTGVARVIGLGREAVARRKDGTTFPVELRITEFRLDGELRFTGVVQDITERRRLEDQFRHAQRMEAVGRLAGGIAHDFNNLLTVINGHSELLLMTMPDGDDREAITAIKDAGDRAARLTRQLLAFSRKSVVEPRLLDLNEIAAEAGKMLRRLIGEDILLTIHPAPTPVLVTADPGQLEQVIMNLAINARDAMPGGGTLTVRTGWAEIAEGQADAHGLLAGRYARLVVADTGCGIPPEVLGRIFEPFFTTKGVGKGTGLGLSVVDGVVRQAGGAVWAESRVGEGTTFNVLLPASAGAEFTTPLPESPEARGVETILLVEDEEAVRRVARFALETQGYTVLEAAGGNEALEILDRDPGPIDLLVTDVVMPGLGGHQVASEARARRPGLRVLFMSGYADDALLLHGPEAAGEAFIQKPFSPVALARKVRSVIDNQP